jgi:hypothetical protein
MLNDGNRIKHLIVGAVVGAFVALAVVMPRADAQGGRAAADVEYDVEPFVDRDGNVQLLILDHSTNRVYVRRHDINQFGRSVAKMIVGVGEDTNLNDVSVPDQYRRRPRDVIR